MLFDTDILIFAQRGDLGASQAIDDDENRYISVQTLMEMLQGARSLVEQRTTKGFLAEYDFKVLPFTEEIGHRALIYVEEYAIGHGLKSADALIAATAVENAIPFLTANLRHYKQIKELDLRVFKPRSGR